MFSNWDLWKHEFGKHCKTLACRVFTMVRTSKALHLVACNIFASFVTNIESRVPIKGPILCKNTTFWQEQHISTLCQSEPTPHIFQPLYTTVSLKSGPKLHSNLCNGVWKKNNKQRGRRGVILTTMPFSDTQQSGGKSWRRGTRYWRQPSQWHRSSIIPIKLNILTTALARS